MFETEAEIHANNMRIVFIVFALLAVVLLAYATASLYRVMSPLPQQNVCSERGYEAGIVKYGRIICYDECASNQVSGCKKMWVQP